MQKIRWKKNLLGYLLWLLFCSMVCCIFVITGTEMLAGVGVEKAGISIAVLCIFAVAEIHIFFRIYGVGEGKEQNRQKEQAGIILAILLLVILRILAASRWGLEPVDRAFFEMAEVTTGQQFLPLIAHKASYIYLCWLSALFRFFGSGCCDAAADADGSFSVVLSVCQETDGQDSCFLVFGFVSDISGVFGSL